MAASKRTSVYKLPIFQRRDKPSWLGDVNDTNVKLEAALVSQQNQIDILRSQIITLQKAINR